MKTDGKADIGAAVSKRFGYAAVVAVIPGGPADKAGVENSDIIESIEGKTTHDMSLAEIHRLFSGEVGSTITVAVARSRRDQPPTNVPPPPTRPPPPPCPTTPPSTLHLHPRPPPH